jgi:hypothetical protein
MHASKRVSRVQKSAEENEESESKNACGNRFK